MCECVNYHGRLIDGIKSHNGYVEEHRGRLSVPLWWTHFVVGFRVFWQNVSEGESVGINVKNKMEHITYQRELRTGILPCTRQCGSIARPLARRVVAML